MIWPEFEDEKGNVILEKDKSVSAAGIARMWILIPEGRGYHLDKIMIGLKDILWKAPGKSQNVKLSNYWDCKLTLLSVNKFYV